MFGTLFNFFDTEKKGPILFGVFLPSALVIDALGKITPKKIGPFFSASKKLKSVPNMVISEYY